MNENPALNFIVYSLFGDMSCPEAAVISRAYVDMASHTLTGFGDDYNEKWRCRFEGTQLIRTSLNDLSDGTDFDDWHTTLCNKLIDIYTPDRLSYGQAQKWVNMAIKYAYVLKRLGAMEEDIFPFITDEHKDLFHPPIDSYILRHVLGESASWSKVDKKEYGELRARLNDADFDFLAELHEWNEIAEVQRDYDKKSYAKFLENRSNGSQN